MLIHPRILAATANARTDLSQPTEAAIHERDRQWAVRLELILNRHPPTSSALACELHELVADVRWGSYKQS